MLVKYCNLAREHFQQESAQSLTEFVSQVKRKMIKLDRPSKDESWLNLSFSPEQVVLRAESSPKMN